MSKNLLILVQSLYLHTNLLDIFGIIKQIYPLKTGYVSATITNT